MDGLYFWNVYKEYEGVLIDELCKENNAQLRAQWYDFDTEAFFMRKYRVSTKVILSKHEKLIYPELWRDHQFFHAIVTTISKKKITKALRRDNERYWTFQVHVDRCAVALLSAYYGFPLVTSDTAKHFFNMGLPHIYDKREALIYHYMIKYLSNHAYAHEYTVQEIIKNLEMCIAFNQMD